MEKSARGDWRRGGSEEDERHASLTSSFVRFFLSADQAPKKLEQPIVTICNHMHGTLLRSLDPQLWAKMEELGIEPQIYGM